MIELFVIIEILEYFYSDENSQDYESDLTDIEEPLVILNFLLLLLNIQIIAIVSKQTSLCRLFELNGEVADRIWESIS